MLPKFKYATKWVRHEHDGVVVLFVIVSLGPGVRGTGMTTIAIGLSGVLCGLAGMPSAKRHISQSRGVIRRGLHASKDMLTEDRSQRRVRFPCSSHSSIYRKLCSVSLVLPSSIVVSVMRPMLTPTPKYLDRHLFHSSLNFSSPSSQSLPRTMVGFVREHCDERLDGSFISKLNSYTHTDVEASSPMLPDTGELGMYDGHLDEARCNCGWRVS